jgi:CDP-glucose 4,6-dehydratase
MFERKVMKSCVNNSTIQQFNSAFFQGKRVLITGHTGFKGSWLTLWLLRLGAHVTGIALPPQTTPNLFTLLGLNESMHQQISDSTNQRFNSSTVQQFNSSAPHLINHYCDIRDAAALGRIVQAAEPEIVLHLAAQPLVRTSYRDPLATFSTNVMGTANLLDAVRNVGSVRVVVVVTTDKVYSNLSDQHINRSTHQQFNNSTIQHSFSEDDPLGGHDPYSASKACAELVTACYRTAFFNDSTIQRFNNSTTLATARAGNVIGGGDWSEDRLIPDAVRAWQSGQPLEIRRPQATRPWQHVLEPLAGYLALAQKLWDRPEVSGAYNFGPEPSESATVRKVVELARSVYGHGEILWGDGSEGPHEADWLSLECAKARNILGITPRWQLAETVERTMNWYRRLAAGEDARVLCLTDITDYEAGL